MFDFTGLFTVRVDGVGARKILEAHATSGLKMIILLQSTLAPKVWHVLVTESTDPKKPWSEKIWTEPDLRLLDQMLKVFAKQMPQLREQEFVSARHLEKFLADHASMQGQWTIGVDAAGLKILEQAGCTFEILPPQ